MSEVERHIPEHPLPEEIRNMGRDDTVCKFCGVSYLIHREIKALEDKLKAIEEELKHYKGCESRELAAKADLLKAQSQLEGVEQSLIVKENELANCKDELRSKDEEIKTLNTNNRKLQDLMSEAVKGREQASLKLQMLQRNLPSLLKKIQQQTSSINEMKTAVKRNNVAMKDECERITSSVLQRCTVNMRETETTKVKLKQMEEEKTQLENRLSAMNTDIRDKDEELNRLASSEKQLNDLRNTVRGLREELAAVQSKLDSNKNIGMEAEQYKEQIKSKNQDLENLTQQMKSRDQIAEQNISKLQFELKQKNAEIEMLEKDSRHLKGKFMEQQRQDEEMKRRASASSSETREMRETLKRAQDDLAALKAERELMITSHQNRIEQLRESFKNKMYEAEKWPERLEEALTKERHKHASEMRALEEKLKENFVMELQIEKQKHQELLNKYKAEARENEAKIKEQINGASGRLKSELEDLRRQLRETKMKAQETEGILRQEIESLKTIIRDLENRLGKLDVGNEEKVVSLKGELKVKSLELAESHQENRKLEEQVATLKEEIVFLQETVRRECEERFELTEALSEAKEQLLALKRPSGGYPTSPQNAGNSGRRGSQLSDSLSGSRSNMKSSRSEEMLIFKKRQGGMPGNAQIPHPPGRASPLAKDLTQNINMTYEGEARDNSPGRIKGGSLADGRKRIANALGKR